MINSAESVIRSTKEADRFSFFFVAEKLLEQLPQRSQNILKKRFGLMGDFSVQTLEKIGSEYEITRERVRQIITDAKKHIIKKCEEVDFQKAEREIFIAIEKRCGIIKEQDILIELNPKGLLREESALRFIVSFSRKIKVTSEKNRTERVWTILENSLEKVLLIDQETRDVLVKSKELWKEDALLDELFKRKPEFSRKEILSYLSVLSGVQRSMFGKWGMSDWPEINPKGSREKIYLVLKEEGKPLHFTVIAKLIEKYKLGKKKAHPQTIHNELIRDERFVLIGRGIYALSEWGYAGGAVKDVLKSILVKSTKPMKKEDIMQKVFEMRKVKKTTVMINLNSDEFEKIGSGYQIKSK